jgi:hypothetical protein
MYLYTKFFVENIDSTNLWRVEPRETEFPVSISFADLLMHVPINVPYKVLDETDPS